MGFSRLMILPVASIALVAVGMFVLPATIFWGEILPVVGFVFLAVGSWLIVYCWYKRVPKVARLITQAVQAKSPLAIIAHDTGRCALTRITEYLGEGIVQTTQGLYKILPQFAPLKQNDGEDGENKVQIFEKEYRDFISKRSILTGANLPIFFGYSGKLCLLNPEALALYEAGEMQVRTADGKLATLHPTSNPNPKGNPGNTVVLDGKTYTAQNSSAKKKLLSRSRGQTIKDTLTQPLMLLDLRKIKDLISTQFNVSQIGALIVESERIGQLGRQSFLSKFGLPIGILIALLVGGLALLIMGPDMLSGFGGT